MVGLVITIYPDCHLIIATKYDRNRPNSAVQDQYVDQQLPQSHTASMAKIFKAMREEKIMLLQIMDDALDARGD